MVVDMMSDGAAGAREVMAKAKPRLTREGISRCSVAWPAAKSTSASMKITAIETFVLRLPT